MTMAYRLRNTGQSSTQLGLCECCETRCNDVYILVIFERYEGTDGNDYINYKGDVFGHKECLSKLTER